MPLELTTGVPGAGKSLYTVAEVLKPMTSALIEIEGRSVPRRLCIAGIPDLLLPHELMEARPIHPDQFTDPWGDVVRKPGQSPISFAREKDGKWVACEEDEKGAQPVPMLAENWWVWVQPGDVVVIDECQTVFRPMPAGRRAPMFIRQLEVHRHYGIDFVLVTQHPQLLHANVRSLVGKHRHVRRLFGRGAAIVYEWDHCSPPDRIRTAASSVWRYKKAAFGLYKSAQLHTKQRFNFSLPLMMGLAALVATPALIWWIMQRGVIGGVREAHDFSQKAVMGAAPASAPAGTVGAGAGAGVVQGGPSPRGPAWPVYASTVGAKREPLADLAIVFEGEWTVGRDMRAVFGLYADGKRVASVLLSQLVAAGYVWQRFGPCMGLLQWGESSRPVSCGPGSPMQALAAVAFERGEAKPAP